jgi:hypothetical protein
MSETSARPVGSSRRRFLHQSSMAALAGLAAMVAGRASAQAGPSASPAVNDTTCSPVNCGDTGCINHAHIFSCRGACPGTRCFQNRTCNSFGFLCHP